MARPSIYSLALAEKICARLARTGSLTAVCKMDGMPGKATVLEWARDDREGFTAMYAQARADGFDHLVEETLAIADEPIGDSHGEAMRAKLRVETRRWIAERCAPRKYGLHTALELTGTDGAPLLIDDKAREARIAELMALSADRARAAAGEMLVAGVPLGEDIRRPTAH